MSSHDYHPEDSTPAGRDSGFHRISVGHLVMGIAFVGLTIVWALYQTDNVTLPEQGWVTGLPWLVGGAVGLIVTAVRGKDPQTGRMKGWIDPNSPGSGA